MKGGFSFCGIDIEDIGLHYAPENKDTYVYAPSLSNVHEEVFDGHDGGYAYGAYKQPKEFVLRCYYEQTHVASGLMANFYSLFKVGKTGLLVFKRRPWCYYYATVSSIDAGDMHNYLNGLVVITMKAYYPFARGYNIIDGLTDEEATKHLFYNLRNDPYHEEIMQNTAIMDKEIMVPQMSFTDISTQTEIVLLNPGTERAKVSLNISGQAGENSSDGVTIYNKTTDQICRYVAFDTSENEYIYTDGISGKTVLDNGITRNLAFMYHDFGFIELEPSFPAKRDIFATYNHNTVTTTNILYDNDYEKEWYKNKYVYLDAWYKIYECTDKHTLTIYPRNQNVQPITERNQDRIDHGQSFDAYPDTGEIRTTVVVMNELVITPAQNAYLSKLNFIYKPTFA